MGKWVVNRGHSARALPVLHEGCTLAQKEPRILKKAATMKWPGSLLGFLWSYGRLQEDTEVIATVLAYRLPTHDDQWANPMMLTTLTQLYVEPGEFEKAVKRRREMEALIEAPDAGWNAPGASAELQGRKMLVLAIHLATMAEAYEALGPWEECLAYHNKGSRLLVDFPTTCNTPTILDRVARFALAEGDVGTAETKHNFAGVREHLGEARGAHHGRSRCPQDATEAAAAGGAPGPVGQGGRGAGTGAGLGRDRGDSAVALGLGESCRRSCGPRRRLGAGLVRGR